MPESECPNRYSRSADLSGARSFVVLLDRLTHRRLGDPKRAGYILGRLTARRVPYRLVSQLGSEGGHARQVLGQPAGRRSASHVHGVHNTPGYGDQGGSAVTLGAMTQPPIVPGPGEPEPLPVWPEHQEVPPPQYPPPQPIPVYQPQSAPPPWNPGRAAGNTVVVILTLVGIFCVLPLLACLIMGTLGNLSSH